MPQLVAVQLDITWEDREENHRRVRELLRADSPQAGSLVVLPEMFASGFSMNVDVVAEDGSRPTEAFLIETARDLGIFLVAGLIAKAPSGKGINQSLTVSPDGGILARYSKLHPFCIGGEKECYEAGSEIVTFRWHEFTVAPFICYDLRFTEIFREATRRGANLFTVIASWPDSRINHWVTLLQARAIENQAYVIGVNRVGNDPTPLQYPGRSLIVDPLGNILADACDRQTIARADVSIDHVSAVRERLPFLKDMRDVYDLSPAD